MMKDIRLEMTCPFCGADHHVDCREEQYNAYCNGELAQVAFDDLNATEREQIISHICQVAKKKSLARGLTNPHKCGIIIMSRGGLTECGWL